MHRELEWSVSKATCLYAHLYMMYRHLYKIIEGTRVRKQTYELTPGGSGCAKKPVRDIAALLALEERALGSFLLAQSRRGGLFYM